MPKFQVKLFPSGKWDGNDHQNIEAETAHKAAEKLYGKPLKLTGSNYQLRAKVRDGFGLRGTETFFYEA